MQEIKEDSQVKEFLGKYDTLLLDMDGVIWRGDRLLPGVSDTLKKLRKSHRLLFVTNNSTKSRKSYLRKFHALGLTFVTRQMLIVSSYALAIYLNEVVDFDKDKKNVYVIGQEGIEEELQEVGIETIGGSKDREPWDHPKVLAEVHAEPNVGAVVCGFDFWINYKKLSKAFKLLQDPNCLFVATNRDATYPASSGILPGTGALLEPLIVASGRQPTVVGKPHRPMLDAILKHFSLDRGRTCMIGDRLDSDIAFGKAGEISTLAVLSGVSSRSDVVESDPKIRPDYMMDNLAILGTAGSLPN